MANLFELLTDALPGPCRVLALEAREALSSLYAVEVWSLVPIEDAQRLDDAVDQPATLAAHADDGSHRMRLCGVIAEVELARAGSDRALYRTVLRPRMHRMTLNAHSRVWVNKRFPDILEERLRAAGLRSGDDYELSLHGRYPEMEHVCQYHESDFTFISRWLEREGISYFFEHGDAGERVVFCDDPGVFPQGPGAVRYFPNAPGDVSAWEGMRAFGRTTRVRAQQLGVADHDPLHPSLVIAATEPVVDGGQGVVQRWGGNLANPAEASRIARVRAQELALPQTEFSGVGRVFGLHPGLRFELNEHPRHSLNEEYLVTATEHRGVAFEGAESFAAEVPWLRVGTARPPQYECAVRAVLARADTRPPCVTPWPRVRGIERAVVDGPLGDNHAELDAHGRYHVKIRFDESDLRDGKASCWVRMAQPHAGNPEGWHFPLRKGTEVMLAFLGGDPDRPVIVGAVPDAQNPSTVTDANRTQNVVMTGGENRIEIEDQDGSQYVSVFSPTQRSTLHLGAIAGPYPSGHNATISTDGTGLVHTGGDRNITVGGNQTEDVTGDLTETYHSDQTTHVFGAFKETVDGGTTQEITPSETRDVSGGLTETISGGETRSVGADQTEDITGAVVRTVTGAVTEDVGGSVTEQVDAAYTQTITGALTQTIAGSQSMTNTGHTVIATGGVSIVAAGGFNVTAPGGITVIDSFIDMQGIKHDGNCAFKNEAGIMKYDLVGMVIAYAAIKSEFTGAVSGEYGAAGKTEIVKMLQAALKNDSGPAHVNVTGVNPNT
jgi:type VI secretion system secreted protein VgrG